MVNMKKWKLVFGGVYCCMVDMEKWKLVFGGDTVSYGNFEERKVSV